MKVDMRSDTVTKPSKEMIDVMFNAKVGDDVFEEDPSVNDLQEYAAAYFGKEAALYCSSGTQTNQIAINIHVSPGGEVICHEESHIYKYEGAGIAKNSGASVRLLRGDRGRINVSDVNKWINPADDVHYPLTQLVSIEDTTNRGGGAIYDFEEIKKIRSFTNDLGIPLHLDGARAMNAIAAKNMDPKIYAAQFDSLSICLSKGLGAPVGSLLLGNKDFIYKARRVRKVFGGGMRQAGFIAAAGKYALQNNVSRLNNDRDKALQIERTLQSCDWLDHVIPVETNIVIFILKEKNKRDHMINYLENNGILSIPFGDGMIRLVTHLDLSDDHINYTCDVIKKATI